MRWVLACCDDTVVAGTAGTYHLRVVDRKGRYPDIGVVAVLADIRRLNMRPVLTDRFNTVMAAHAISNDAYMIEVCRQPTR